MRNFILAVLCLFLPVCNSYSAGKGENGLSVPVQTGVKTADGSYVKTGDDMPAFTIVHDDGTNISSSSFKGKVVLINFFATWCPPCQKELAEIHKSLWPKYKDNKDFVLLVIGREHNDAELKVYNDKKGFKFPLYPDKSRAVYSAFAENLIPRSYLIGKDGKISYSAAGFTPESFDLLMDNIEKSLKK